jgi:hypothetical protein
VLTFIYFYNYYLVITSEGLQQVLNVAGFNPIKDANVVCIGPKNDALRPADILANGDRSGHQVCIDVTVVSNMCENLEKLL